MRECLLCCFLIVLSNWVQAQAVAIQNDRQNTLTVGINNPIHVAVEGYNSKDLIVTMDSAFVTGSKGVFDLLPRVPSGDLLIHVGVKTSNGIKEVEIIHVRTECLIVKEAFLLGKWGGNISIKDFRAAIAIQAPIIGYEFSASVKITGFSIILEREDVIIFNKHISGARIDQDESIVRMKADLKRGDKVKFLNIRYLGPDGPRCAGTLNPMEFIIVD